MVILSVVYPRSGATQFDFDYYSQTHLPLVSEKLGPLGLKGAYALRGTAAAGGGDAPYFALAFLSFESAEMLAAALASPLAGEVLADIAKFTDAKPVMQVNEHIR